MMQQGKMPHWYLLSLAIFLLALKVQANENGVKTSVFLSPKFVLGTGQVAEKFYHNIDFPRGHIAIKEFFGEVVDEWGNSVPLHEAYLHHWVIDRYYAPKGVELTKGNGDSEIQLVRNAGVCQGNSLPQYFGVGSETRKTETYIPDPYGIEVGNPVEIPNGFEEQWLLNVHAIDTRLGVVDQMGCTECRCDLYNITIEQSGRPLPPGYTGGLGCCYDGVQCRVKEGFESIKRSLYLRYTVKWVEWEDNIVPVKIYILDVTDDRKSAHDSTKLGALHGCKVEYQVESCGANGLGNSGCIDTKKASIVMPHGGALIYGVAHQHSGGAGATLYGEDGRVICSSLPAYGEGKEAGNEAGYIVGMSSCYPQPGTVSILDGETVILESNYNSTEMHTGVMALFYILVADSPPKHMLSLQTSVHKLMTLSKYSWAFVFIGVAVVAIIGVGYLRRNEREDGYQSIVI